VLAATHDLSAVETSFVLILSSPWQAVLPLQQILLGSRIRPAPSASSDVPILLERTKSTPWKKCISPALDAAGLFSSPEPFIDLLNHGTPPALAPPKSIIISGILNQGNPADATSSDTKRIDLQPPESAI
jgi:hypothetical protein